ncbi:putative ribonuclease H-like domain-containing protein [Tanacetum coccineum]
MSPILTSRIHSTHPKALILGDPNSAVQTRSKVNTSSRAHAFVSYIQKVWVLVDLPYGKKAIGTKWVYRNKKDERGVVVRNKARLVAQGHRQEEGIDYDEVFAPVARLEAIRIFLAFASYMGFIVYQMDVKSAFLYGKIDERGYVSQPPGFLDPKYPQKVYKVVKALYGLHQAPRACTPIETQKPLVKDEEASDVDVHLYRSMIGSLMYLTASRPDIMFAVCACSRFQVTPKSSHLSAVKRIFRYLKGKPKLGLWYPKVSSFDLESYSDSDYARANLDRKSTTGGCQFLGRRLISWQCKKQTIVATSTTEAEYVAAASCCGQVLWIQNQMLDYGFNFMNTKIYIDNESTICIVKNPSEGNAEFHEIIDFLKRSSIHHALTVPIEHSLILSPRPSPTTTIPDSIPYLGDQAKEIQDLKAQITKLKKQAKPVIKQHKAWLKSVSLKQRFPRKSFSKKHRVHKESVSKQGRKFAKGESSVQRDPLFDEIPEDTVDHMETENAQNEGRTREMVDEDKEIDENILSTEDVLSTDKEGVSTDMEKVSTDRPIVSTDGSKVSTDRQNEGTEEKNEGTEEKNEGTEEHIEGTEEHIEGTEEQVESTDGHKKVDERDARKNTRMSGKQKRKETEKLKTKFNEVLIKKRDEIKASIEADKLLAEKHQEQER